MTTESGQLDVIALLREHADTAQSGLGALEDALNPQIDANPNDKLLLEILDLATDAQESLTALFELLDTMERRDQEG